MEWLWILQLGFNLVGAVSLIVWWKGRAAANTQPGALQDWDAQAQELEREVLLYRKKAEDQLRFLIQVCEQAHSILMRQAQQPEPSPVSLEEQELRALRAAPPVASSRSIPSVQELEVRKQAVRAEIPIDLRSLLRDQLT